MKIRRTLGRVQAPLHMVLTIGFAILIPVSFWTGWVESLPFVTVLSLWALVASHWAAYEAAKAAHKDDDPET